MIFQINGRNFELSQRETETLKLIAEGCSNGEVAAELGITVKTVEKHRQSVLNKTGIHRAVILAHFAISRGLVKNAFAKEPNG